MKKKNIINSILQNTRMPEGFFGRIILRGMNKGHASLSRWGLSQIEWKSDWTILDIGCGGGNAWQTSVRKGKYTVSIYPPKA